jgi:cell wall-associated NlpC family hydrolase
VAFSNILNPSAAALVAVLAAGCASGSANAVPQPFPKPVGGSAAAAGIANGPAGLVRVAVVGSALKFQGVPYRNGGSDPSGFDCSGFTQYVFAQFHVSLPRDVRTQWEAGVAIPAEQIAPGDLVFFSTTEPGPSHVGIALDDDQFVHAPSSNGVVRVERRHATYWASRFVGARRITLP